MKKHIAAVIAAINSLLVVGICGAIECDTMPLGKAFIICLICSAIAIVSAKALRDEERAEDEAALRSAARAARLAEFAEAEELSRLARRPVRTVALVRR
mgnify:FL=1